MMVTNLDTQTSSTPIESPSRSARLRAIGSQFRLGPVLTVLVLVWVLFGIQNPRFLSPVNLSNLTLQVAVTATIALGLVFVLLLGEIDLSVAALSGVCAALTANCAVEWGWHPVPAILAGLALGVAWALAQALIVLYGAPSFIVTLAGSLALAGVLLVLLPEAGQISLSNNPLRAIAGSYLTAPVAWVIGMGVAAVTSLFFILRYQKRRRRGLPASVPLTVVAPVLGTFALTLVIVLIMNAHRGVPVMFTTLMIIVLLFAYITTQTRLGARIYAVGGNREAARRAGIPVGRTVLIAFALAGLFAALGGIFAASRLLGVSNQSGGGTLLLEAIAAAVIGGTSLFGGKGTVWSAVLGALLIGSISNGMDLLGLSTEIKLIVTGSILVAATVADVVLSRGSFSWRKK